jgi:hypothetical protein
MYIFNTCRQFLPVMRLMLLKDKKGETIMKKFAILSSVMLIFYCVAIEFSHAGRIGNRQVKQQKRIYQGVKSGELTKKETLRLEREQHRIQKTKHNAFKDGELTPKERLRLERQQNRANRHIFRLKHNKKTK